MRAISIKLATLAAVAVCGAIALPGSASAAITCDFGGSVLTVTLNANNEFPIIDRSGPNIRVQDNLGADPVCSGDPATVTNTERIAVNQPDPGETAQVVIDQSGGAFEPGTGGPAEGGGTSEIEFDIDLGDGFDSVQVDGRPDPEVDHMRLGELASGNPGVNLNAPETAQPDGDDIELEQVDFFSTFAGGLSSAPNIFDASGGPEFTEGFPLNIGGVALGEGPDNLIGGDRGGTYDAGGGNDTVFSTPESSFSETLRGGADTDTLSYSRATGPVAIDLGMSAGQDTGGGGFDVLDQTDFEDLAGGTFGDTLTGTDAANRIVGAGGADTLNLLDGPDQFEVMDGLTDTVNCGDGSDSGVADEQGVDSINADCETVDFPPQTSIAAGPANGATIADRTPTYAIAADEAATFERRVDGGPFQPCPASCTIPSLSDGVHALAFRATDQDPPATPDPTPTTRSVTIDTTPPPGGGGGGDDDPPETTIVDGPKRKTRKKSVTLEFVSDEQGSRFECALDERGFSPCSSPARVKARRKGRHSFDVHAIDAAGNVDQTPATHTWKRKRKRR
ncbi:MAG: hypothetical protein ACRDL3_10655 [Solirubrobacterales bacterium]